MELKNGNNDAMNDERWAAMAKEYEEGAWAGLGEVTMGRPRLYDEDLATVSFRLPRSQIEAVAQTAKRQGISKSEFYRRAIDRALVAAGA